MGYRDTFSALRSDSGEMQTPNESSHLISLAITDDQTLFRKGLLGLVRQFERVGSVYEASNGKELTKLLAKVQLDVVLLDLVMPVMDGFEAARIIAERYPDVKVLIITMHEEGSHLLELMNIGVHGFLLKNAEPEEVEKAVYSVVDRDFYKNGSLMKALKLIDANPQATGKSVLSYRELQILRLICQEKTMREISLELCISERTTHSHRANMLMKIGARNTVGLVKYAYAIGLEGVIGQHISIKEHQ